jgi:hypothetical protein
VTGFVSPLAGILYEQAWGPWAGTHRRGQNWQSGSAWDLLHDAKRMPVRAPFAGEVVSAGQGGAGRFAGSKVGIQGERMSCFLTHMSALSVTKGTTVEAGHVVGTTGQANGVWHLHVALGGSNYFDFSDANGIDPKPFLEGSAVLIAEKGPRGYPQYRGLAAATTFELKTAGLADGDTLRLVLHGDREGTYAGWAEAAGPLLWIAKHGLKPETQAAISWRGNTWRGAKDVENVAKNLVVNFLTKE